MTPKATTIPGTGSRRSFGTRAARSILRSPARVSILSFAAAVFLGAALLRLPGASTGEPVDFVDALFTATSAACVTGLSVLDTGTDLTAFGQVVVLALVQVGGLGIMTLSTVLLMALGRRPSMVGHVVIYDTLTHGGEKSLGALLKDVVLFTLAIEVFGAAVLFFQFLPGRSAAEALYFGVFHAVSAFCNAGFSLFADSLVGYRDNLVLNLTICFLIVAGGLGFLVLSEIKRKRPHDRRSWSRLSLHTKLVLSSTALLIFLSSLTIILMEWHNTLAPLPFPKRLLAGFFQAVTTRTAGFNTVPVEQFAVVGLGNFGFYLASRLYEKGHEVLAVDKDHSRVQAIRDQVSQAVVADATDRKAIENLGFEKMDAAVVCTGTVLSDSILAVLNLKEIGVGQVYAKAVSEAHGRILGKIGASETVFPERDMAISLAERLHNPNMIDYIPILEGFSIIQLAPPRRFIGKSLRELDLTNRLGVQVVAVIELVPDRLNLIPTAQFVVKDSDILILLGPYKVLDELRKEK